MGIFSCFFYIFAAPMNKYFAKPKHYTMDMLSCFGQSKHHGLFLLRSDKVLIQTALVLGGVFQHPFSFIGGVCLSENEPESAYPLYLATMLMGLDVSLVLMPNKTTVPAQDLYDEANPLLGLALFDEYYYLFNKQGRKRFSCEHVDYDYLLLLYSDKNLDVNQEVFQMLGSVKQIKAVDASSFLVKDGGKKAGNIRVEFLQRLFLEVDVIRTSWQEEQIRKKLCNVTSIPNENYAHRRFQENKISLLPLLDTPLMQRQDF